MSDSGIAKKLKSNLEAVENRLAQACARAGRRRAEVTLVAVTKTVTPLVAQKLVELGALNLGESRPQELWFKAAALPPTVRWHLIGHLQRNKIARTLNSASRIHSVDSMRLLEALEVEAFARAQPTSVFLEVNASGEDSKQGWTPADLLALLPKLRLCRHVQVHGLMTMAPLQPPESCRPVFAKLRELRDRMRSELEPPHVVEHLSMGMSNDFEVAVEEGATFVRLGSVLFEGLNG